MFNGCLCTEETIFPQLKFAPVIPGEFPEVSRESRMEESEDVKGSTYLQMWQARKREGKQEAKKTCREFFVL